MTDVGCNCNNFACVKTHNAEPAMHTHQLITQLNPRAFSSSPFLRRAHINIMSYKTARAVEPGHVPGLVEKLLLHATCGARPC